LKADRRRASVDGPAARDLTRHSAPGQEIKTSATPGPSRECWFGDSDKLFQPFVTMKLAGLSFALSI